jgi:amidohydrolase
MDPSRPVGTIGVRHGDFTADCHEMKIEIHGRGAHAARPHEGVDPIAIAAQLISSIYLFVPRSTDSQDAVVVTFGQIHGGHSSNVIPDHVVLRGTLRTLDSGVSEATIRHITRLARGLAEASESVIDIQWESGPPPVKNDAELVNLLTEAGKSVVGATNVHPIRRASMGGEDFANYLTKVRGAMFRLGSSPGPGPAPPLHNPLFDIDERSLAIGAQILAHAVIRWCDPKSPANKPSPGNTPAPTSLAP